ncbi:Hypothetical protein NTJ_11063 [Nesidiocoris tenuis]|uniref:Matrin-type domain-containing protein n=1 Tax=Nesidiocoris tenuis TaxID=355587 RepID=A0ABN7B1G1_9HEMI|nr:Hypothetical protein NTJ_11063 [Nesidiocoris tenuis]
MSYYSRGTRGSGYRGSSGFRGSRGSSDSFRGRGSSRGSFGSNRGGNRYFSNASSSSSHYDSRPPRGGGPDKFSRSRNSDEYHGSGYKDDSYSSRDYKRSSPEPPRKRGRPEGSVIYSSSRRSPDRYSSTDYHRFDKGSSSGGGYLSEKGTYREVRESKPEFSFRRPGGTFATRGSRGLRSRGRSSLRSARFRGTGTRGFKSATSILARRRLETLGVRKRYPSEYVRKFSTHSRTKRFSSLRGRKSDDEEDDDEMVEGEEDEAEEEIEEEVEEEEDMQEMGDDEDVGMEDEDQEEVKEGDEGEDVAHDEEEAKDGDEQEEDGVKEEKETIEEKKEDEASVEKKETEALPKKKSPAKKEPAAKKKIIVKKVTKKIVKTKAKKGGDAEEKESEVEKEESKENEAEEADDGKPARFKCPHCRYGSETAHEYSRHLDGKKHKQAMMNLSTKLRSKLTGMRIDQRNKQKILDEEARANNMKLRTFYCQICKLNFRTLKSEHFSSVAHKKMKEFLIPFCRLCKIPCKSPWAYENHLSDLSHLKRKASRKESIEEMEKDVDVDPSDFMVLDAVGSGDEDDESGKSGGEEGEEKATKDGEPPKKKKKEINLGAEHCKIVEVYYCELCKIYLSRYESREQALASHCRSRTHLQRYIRYRDDQSLRRKAVKVHKEFEKEKEEASKKMGKEVKESEDDDQKPAAKKEEDKGWSEVDKDLSDLLHDEEGGQEAVPDEEGGHDEEQADEDEDSQHESERYDRFKKSEKEKESAKAAVAAANGSIAADEKKKLEPEASEK